MVVVEVTVLVAALVSRLELEGLVWAAFLSFAVSSLLPLGPPAWIVADLCWRSAC